MCTKVFMKGENLRRLRDVIIDICHKTEIKPVTPPRAQKGILRRVRVHLPTKNGE